MIKWNISKKDQGYLDTVLLMICTADPHINIVSTEMDLIACHRNGNPIDFEKLMFFDEFSFFHDVYGIRSHLDRNTGKLKNFFVPRCSKVRIKKTRAISKHLKPW